MLRFIHFLFLFLLTSGSLNAAGRLSVFVSVAPQKYLVEQLLGDDVEVGVMVQPGHNPETYTPAVHQMERLAKADLYSAIGVPFESVWLGKIQSLNPNLQIHHFQYAHQQTDHHAWTDPIMLMEYATTLSEVFIRRLPSKSDMIKDNLRTLLFTLRALDQRVRQRFIHLSNRHFVVFHAAWGHFAKRYQLEQLAITRDDEEVSAKRMTEVMNEIKNKQVKLMLVQPQHGSRVARHISESLQLEVVTVNPLEADPIAMLDALSLAIWRVNR